MKEYIGTKQVFAEPQERDGKPGYKVQYPPDGYESWSPQDQFDAAYEDINELNFGHAVYALLIGRAAGIVRASWSGVGLTAKLQVPDANSKMTEPYLYLEHAQGARFPWTPSTVDIFANDWQLVDEQGAIIQAGATDAFNQQRADNPVAGESVGPEADTTGENVGVTGTDVPVQPEEVTVEGGEQSSTTETNPSTSDSTQPEGETTNPTQPTAPDATGQSQQPAPENSNSESTNTDVDTTPSPEEQQEGTAAQQTAQTELEQNTAEADEEQVEATEGESENTSNSAPTSSEENSNPSDAEQTGTSPSSTPEFPEPVKNPIDQDGDGKCDLCHQGIDHTPTEHQEAKATAGQDTAVDFDFTNDKDDTGN